MITKAKKSLENKNVIADLVKISSQHNCFTKLAIQMESSDYTIEEAVETLFSINFGEDENRIKNYLLKRLEKMTLLLLRI